MAKKTEDDDRPRSGEPSTPKKATPKKARVAASTPRPKNSKVKKAAAPTLAARRGAQVVAVPTHGFDTFFLNVLNELADNEFADTDDDTAALGIYYGPVSDPTNVFVIWVTKGSSNGQFKPNPILGFINSAHFSVTLNSNQSYIQHVVDVDTISELLRQGSPGNHPDGAIFNRLFGALRAKKFRALSPTSATNPKTAIAQAVIALFP